MDGFFFLDSEYAKVLNMPGLHMLLNKILYNRYLTGFCTCLEFLEWHAIIIVIAIIEILS